MHSVILAITVSIVLLGGLAGCTPTVTYGVKPQTERLEKLVVGQSSAADILLTLGEPRGTGVAHLSKELPSRDVWFYEFVKSDGATVTLDVLIVFLLGDRYDGHLWFDSVDAVNKEHKK